MGADQPESDEGGILDATMQLREVSSGMRLAAASAWFSFRPDRWQGFRDNPPSLAETSSSISSSEDTEGDSISGSTTVGSSQASLRVMKVKGSRFGSGCEIETKQGIKEVGPNGPLDGRGRQSSQLPEGQKE